MGVESCRELVMIDVYTWSTPNGYKVLIMLEETGLEYRLHPVDLGQGEQRRPEFLAINPNGKIPAIIDRDGHAGEELTIFESGAILLYLAEKSSRFLPSDPHRRWSVISWLMFQMGGVGPMLGQAGYFLNRAPEPVSFAVERFATEAERLYGVVDRRLRDREYLDGEYSIADIACFPWMRAHRRFGLDIADYPNLARWLRTIDERPAVTRALELI
jgi:GST-like protein